MKIKELRFAYDRQLEAFIKLSKTPKHNINGFTCHARLAKLRESKKRLKRLEKNIELAILDEKAQFKIKKT